MKKSESCAGCAFLEEDYDSNLRTRPWCVLWGLSPTVETRRVCEMYDPTGELYQLEPDGEPAGEQKGAGR